jgi:hypothetical protein
MSATGAERKCWHGSLPAALQGIPENICSSRHFLTVTHAVEKVGNKIGNKRSEAHVLELFFKVGFPRALAAAPERDSEEPPLGNLDGFAAARLCDMRSSLLVRRRQPDVACECLEILPDGRKVELVAGAGETPRTHALEAMVDLEVREAHLHFLALIPRLFKFRG